jgi:hypothetical protein
LTQTDSDTEKVVKVPSNEPAGRFIADPILKECCLSVDIIREGLKHAYKVLDVIDASLRAEDLDVLSKQMEGANYSTFVSNLIVSGIAKASGGKFERAGPHKYQDLRSTKENECGHNIEAKIAIETRMPKGHLPKEGYYLACRYVMCDEKNAYCRGSRGSLVRVWEIRVGKLVKGDFSSSNTEGDSGKTATVRKESFNKLSLVYVDRSLFPYASTGKIIEYFPEEAELVAGAKKRKKRATKKVVGQQLQLENIDT